MELMQRGRRASFWIVVGTGLLLMLPFLGLSEFNTKGEPREAVVSLTMLEQHNWILPVNNDNEIPYKPPMLHWCISVASVLTGCHVTEYTSRLPSALALTALAAATFWFFSAGGNRRRAFCTALLTLTAFETYRAGMACRVDMLLTALTVGALYALYDWQHRGARKVPWAAIILMSAATLTKGPVGMVVPCLCTGIFMLVRGFSFWRTFLLLTAWGLLSLILPLCWYAAAYGQGGKEFLDLVLEENFGRMTGTMAYESHLNPWPYNLLTLLTGFLPWTLLAVISLFAVHRHRLKAVSKRKTWLRAGQWMLHGDPKAVFALICAVTIFIFYCLPASKRSVYLMPMYPFTAFWLAALFDWLAQRHKALVKGFANALAVLCCLVFGAFIVLKIMGPDAFASMKPRTGAMLSAIAGVGDFLPVFWACTAPVTAIAWWLKKLAVSPLPACFAMVVALYLGLAGCYQPAVLNTKSVKDYSAMILERFPEAGGNLYEYIPSAEAATGNPVHFFEIDFYTQDGVLNFLRRKPSRGYLLLEKSDEAEAVSRFGQEGYRFRRIVDPAPRRPKHTPCLYEFEITNP